MGFFNKKELQEIEDLKKSLAVEKSKSIELGINKLEDSLLKVKESEKELQAINSEITKKKSELQSLIYQIRTKQKEIINLDDEITMQGFGIYNPIYKFANSEQYKDKLKSIRQEQKNLIKNKSATSIPDYFTLDGSATKGKALVNDNVKQILRSFNNECDILINNVKFNNIDNSKKRIKKSFEQLNKMNSRMQIRLKTSYLKLKLDELNLAHEYALKKQEEKEAQKEERERLREEAKLRKEIEEARKAAEKEKTHYQNALQKLLSQLEKSPDDVELIKKKDELEKQLGAIAENLKEIDYREANKRAGYVYIISNIGSFGENVYKIGMTRRLEPMDRVNELGDASVPFNFDVHAMIFSDDAPALETALHKAFENKKVNMINTRREFFAVTLDEIKTVIKANFDKTVDFVNLPEAEQYRKTLMLKKQKNL